MDGSAARIYYYSESNGHVYELAWIGRWVSSDLTAITGAAPLLHGLNSRTERGWSRKKVNTPTGDREMLWGGRRGNGNFVAASNRWSAAMPQPNDLSRSLVALDQNSTIIAVVEVIQSSWLVGGVVPGY